MGAVPRSRQPITTWKTQNNQISLEDRLGSCGEPARLDRVGVAGATRRRLSASHRTKGT